MKNISILLLAMGFATMTSADETGFTVCNKDGRKLSDHPYAGRLLKEATGTGGCSSALVGKSCMVTVAHCYGYIQVVEFNTPPSKDGKLQHPGAKDVYEVDRTTLVHGSLSVGDDWAVFRVKKNAETK